MNNGFRQSMTWLHTWTGLVLGWVLYFMFVTGTVGYLDTEIDRWMKPEAPMPVVEMNTTTAIQAGLDHLKTAAPDATHWFISLPRDRNNPYLFTFWREADGNSGRNYLDPTSGQPFETRDSGGGQVLYRMHWQLHYLPDSFTGWFISIATMFMFVALITGIIAHKNIFKDFFTFRPRKGQRSWLDAHNVLSVLTLPFQLMITYSGLIFMMFICMPLIITAFYGSGEADRDRFFDEVFASVAEIEAADKSASLVDIAGPIATAEARWGADGIRYVDIDHPGDANARITLGGTISRSPLRSSPQLIFDGVTGELLTTVPARGSADKTTRDVFLGLHEGLFAGPALRTLYVLSGFLGAAMIATGLVL